MTKDLIKMNFLTHKLLTGGKGGGSLQDDI